MVYKCTTLFQDIKKLLSDTYVCNIISDLLWTKKEKRSFGSYKEFKHEGETNVKREGEELWMEMWAKEIRKREEIQSQVKFFVLEKELNMNSGVYIMHGITWKVGLGGNKNFDGAGEKNLFQLTFFGGTKILNMLLYL